VPPGIPTSLSCRETLALQRWGRERVVVEAGALLGFSTITLAQVARRVVSVDRHVGYNGAPTERRFRSNLHRTGVADRVDVRVGDITDHLPTISADFAFIDLDGTAATTGTALAHLRSSLVGVHDLGRSHCPGVEDVIRRNIHRRLFHPLEHIDTLIIGVTMKDHTCSHLTNAAR
jgi:tRNA A58 N-methylase Trm61